MQLHGVRKLRRDLRGRSREFGLYAPVSELRRLNDTFGDILLIGFSLSLFPFLSMCLSDCLFVDLFVYIIPTFLLPLSSPSDFFIIEKSGAA